MTYSVKFVNFFTNKNKQITKGSQNLVKKDSTTVPVIFSDLSRLRLRRDRTYYPRPIPWNIRLVEHLLKKVQFINTFISLLNHSQRGKVFISHLSISLESARTTSISECCIVLKEIAVCNRILSRMGRASKFFRPISRGAL